MYTVLRNDVAVIKTATGFWQLYKRGQHIFDDERNRTFSLRWRKSFKREGGENVALYV